MRVIFTCCIRCGRPLKNTKAQERGYGAICWKKVHKDQEEIQGTDRPTISDPEKAEETRRKILHRISQLNGDDAECLCGEPIKKGVLCSYDHEGGYEAAGYENPQWFFSHCVKCNYDMALWKCRVKLDDLKSPTEEKQILVIANA